MRRSVCYTSPSVAKAGQISTWHFHYSPYNNLAKGAKLKFDLAVEGRMIDWEIPSTDLSQPSNVIYAETHLNKIIKAKPLKVSNKPVVQFEFTLPHDIEAGETITIVMGAPPQQENPNDELGNGAQLFVQRRKPFYLHVDPTGKGTYEEPEIFSVDIRGNSLKNIKIFTPSYVSRNKRFDITIRFEDEFNNLTNFAPEDTLIELSYEHLRENLNWQLFIPETGFVILPNLYFNEQGIYRINLKNRQTQETFISAPIKCFHENAPYLMWGLLHGESERIDAEENIESCLRHFRDEKSLNFFASSQFSDISSSYPDIWKSISQNMIDFNEEDRFVSLLGFQYNSIKNNEGCRHIICLKDQKIYNKQKDTKQESLNKLYKNYTTKDFIAIPTFTASTKSGYNFKNFNPDFERVVEIYNAWGSSETTKANGNPFPIQGYDTENSEGTILEALKNNCRFGFVAGGLDDRGLYSNFFDSQQQQYSPGLTAILCQKYTKDSVLDALYNRHCYATTGQRIIVDFSIIGHIMGTELSTATKPGLAVNRHISGIIAGTNALKSIELIRNGSILKTFTPANNEKNFTYEYDDMDNISSIALNDPKGGHNFVFYYIRATQIDGAMAWSSPIWIDIAKPEEKK